MVSVLVSGSSGPGSSPGRRHCVVFLAKTLNPHSARGVTLRWTSLPSRGEEKNSQSLQVAGASLIGLLARVETSPYAGSNTYLVI